MLALSLSVAVLTLAQGSVPALADPRLVERLNEEQLQVWRQWRSARDAYERQSEIYWSAVAARRSERRRKISAGARLTPADYVMEQPPKYTGPQLRSDIAKLMAQLVPPAPGTEITTLPEMIDAARQHFGFQPSLVPEREFKRRYAVEALAVGLTKEEVTRIYAFETGGRGTFDMQAGINPDTRQGKAISTALGYAQLLAANSIGELAQYGDGFLARLSTMAARPGTSPERRRELTAKIDAVRAMLRFARSGPREWSHHVALARTPKGYAIHTLNLDGDIGPWLQVIKLKGIKDTAMNAGRGVLSPAELELMNLAGPRTGLEMMEPVGRTAPTANFFSKGAYYRNTIVREKTAAELLAAIEDRMNGNMLRAGSVEFVAVFDEVETQGRALALDERRQLLPPASVQYVSRAASPPAALVSPAVPNSRPSPIEARPPPVPPLPVRAGIGESTPVPPAPVLATRPAANDREPRPRMQWAPRDFGAGNNLPRVFQD
jgi:hypothetical protein